MLPTVFLPLSIFCSRFLPLGSASVTTLLVLLTIWKLLFADIVSLCALHFPWRLCISPGTVLLLSVKRWWPLANVLQGRLFQQTIVWNQDFSSDPLKPIRLFHLPFLKLCFIWMSAQYERFRNDNNKQWEKNCDASIWHVLQKFEMSCLYFHVQAVT